jgi:deoxyribose-phosphate aldolase
MTLSEFAKIFDHTAVKPETTRQDIVQLCQEAVRFGFSAVSVAPIWVSLAAETLAGSSVSVATVVGFPHGSTLSSVKAFESKQVLDAGAHELDMVINIGALKSGEWDAAREDIRCVVRAARDRQGITVKVILETALLTNDEKLVACRLAEEAGADFVKTSTGFAAAGATTTDVALMRRAVGDRLGVKAAGGIKSISTALAMIAAGATRLGTSSSVSIMKEFDDGVPSSVARDGGVKR